MHGQFHLCTKRRAVLLVTVIYQKMNMNVLRIHMHCKQYLKTLFPEELMSEVLRYLVSIFISQFIIVLRMKGYGQLLCKNVPWEEPAVLLLMHFPCHKDTVCKVIPIAAKGII